MPNVEDFAKRDWRPLGAPGAKDVELRVLWHDDGLLLGCDFNGRACQMSGTGDRSQSWGAPSYQQPSGGQSGSFSRR